MSDLPSVSVQADLPLQIFSLAQEVITLFCEGLLPKERVGMDPPTGKTPPFGSREWHLLFTPLIRKMRLLFRGKPIFLGAHRPVTLSDVLNGEVYLLQRYGGPLCKEKSVTHIEVTVEQLDTFLSICDVQALTGAEQAKLTQALHFCARRFDPGSSRRHTEQDIEMEAVAGASFGFGRGVPEHEVEKILGLVNYLWSTHDLRHWTLSQSVVHLPRHVRWEADWNTRCYGLLSQVIRRCLDQILDRLQTDTLVVGRDRSSGSKSGLTISECGRTTFIAVYAKKLRTLLFHAVRRAMGRSKIRNRIPRSNVGSSQKRTPPESGDPIPRMEHETQEISFFAEHRLVTPERHKNRKRQQFLWYLYSSRREMTNQKSLSPRAHPSPPEGYNPEVEHVSQEQKNSTLKVLPTTQSYALDWLRAVSELARMPTGAQTKEVAKKRPEESSNEPLQWCDRELVSAVLNSPYEVVTIQKEDISY